MVGQCDQPVQTGCACVIANDASLVNPLIKAGEFQIAFDATRAIAKCPRPEMRSVFVVAQKRPRSHRLHRKRRHIALNFVVASQRTSKEKVIVIMSGNLLDL